MVQKCPIRVPLCDLSIIVRDSFCSLGLQVVKEHMPDEAATVFEKCINEKALVLSGKVGYGIDQYR